MTVSRAGQAGEEKNDRAQIEMHRNMHVSPTAAPVRKNKHATNLQQTPGAQKLNNAQGHKSTMFLWDACVCACVYHI